MKLSIRNLLNRLLATRTVRVEKPTPWVLWDEDELRADGVDERDIELLREGVVRVPSPDEAIIRQAWEDTRPTPADQAVIDDLSVTPPPAPGISMDQIRRARKLVDAAYYPDGNLPAPRETPPVADPSAATTEEFVGRVAGFRRAYLGDWATPTDAQLVQVRDGLAADTEIAAPSATPAPDRPATLADGEPPLGAQLLAERRIVEKRSGRWPRLLQDQDVSRSRPEPPQPSDYQPTTPPPAPLPRGTGSGPGFARTLERIDDVIAQEAAAKRLYDGLGDPA